MNEKYYLVGTAGHVDHGKTELIRALSGIETDRLKEEKQRGISIELGFAHMTLPSGRRVGIVDVPGHERFVRQMLAGATGLDVVLLVVAADEGIMPQTREHLDILTLLEIPRGIVVLTKIDLVDQEWQELVEEEIREELRDTVFNAAPICPVSALTGMGLPQLVQTIEQQLDEVESKPVVGPVLMPIDRVFSIQGFGTVVTGTLHTGILELGQEIVVEPGHLVTKVRSLQVHGGKEQVAYAGQRVAVNLAGVDVDEVSRGANLATPRAFKVGNILDIKVRNLSSTGKSLVQRQRVRFHHGTVEILGRLHLLESNEIPPNSEGYAQIILESLVMASAGDRFVIRSYSPAHTIAGGKVLGLAEFKYKRFKDKVLALMCLKDEGNPLDLIEREIFEPKSLAELEQSSHLATGELISLLQQLADSKRAELWPVDGGYLYWAAGAAERWRSKLIGTVKAYQKEFPLRSGLGREELKTRLSVSWPRQRWQNIVEEGALRSYYKLVGNKVQLAEGITMAEPMVKRLNCLTKRWLEFGLNPPEPESLARECGIVPAEVAEYVQYLCDQGEWVSANGFYFSSGAVEKARKQLLTELERQTEVSVAEVRDLWGVSRKYAVPLLEYFDQQKVTRRKGDMRVRY